MSSSASSFSPSSPTSNSSFSPSSNSSSSSTSSSSSSSPSTVLSVSKLKPENKKVWHDKKKDFTLAGQSLKWKKKGKDGEEEPVEKEIKKEKPDLKDPMQRICFKFRDTGFCRYGDKCFYKHVSRFTPPKSIPKTLPTPVMSQVKQPIKRPMVERKLQKKQTLRSTQGRDKTSKVDTGKRICESWKRMGCCNFGYQCHYLHTGAYETNGGDAKKGFCRRYEETGFCEYGNRCWYSHRVRRHSRDMFSKKEKGDEWESGAEDGQGKDLEEQSHTEENETESLKIATSAEMDELAQEGTRQASELGDDRHSPQLPELPLHFLPQRLREAAGLQTRADAISPFSFSHPGEPFSPTFGDEYPGIIDLVGQYLQPTPGLSSKTNNVSRHTETPYFQSSSQSVFTQSSLINSGPAESFQSDQGQAKFAGSTKGTSGAPNHSGSLPQKLSSTSTGTPLPFSKFQAPFSPSAQTPSSESHWDCPRCLKVNPVWSRVCSECRAPRPHTVMRSTVDLDDSSSYTPLSGGDDNPTSTDKLLPLPSESEKLETTTVTSTDPKMNGGKKKKKGKKIVTQKKALQKEDIETDEIPESPATWPIPASTTKSKSNGYPGFPKPLSLQDMWDRSHGTGIEQWTEPEIDDDVDSQTNSLQSPIPDEDSLKDDETSNVTDDSEAVSFSTSVSSSLPQSSGIQSKSSVVPSGVGLATTGVCDGCHQQFQLKLLKKCGWCFQTRYCSVACQRLHWKTHKNECHKVIGTKT